MSPITSTIEDSLNGLPEDIREECIMEIKNKRNNQIRKNYQSTNGGNSASQGSNNGQVNKGQGKQKNISSANYEAITCWFCNKKGHTQIYCRSRIKQNKPLTWKNREVKSKFHFNKIMLITDFGDMEEAREWTE